MKELNIVYKDVNELIPYENNPRINDNAVDAVAKSIEQFGFKNPIIIDKDNVIIAGHTRLKAAKQLGIKNVPTILADDLTEEQVKAFRIADNKVAEIAEWNYEKLESELDQINIDMSEFGFFEPADITINDEDFLLDEDLREKELKKIKCPHCGEEFEV